MVEEKYNIECTKNKEGLVCKSDFGIIVHEEVIIKDSNTSSKFNIITRHWVELSAKEGGKLVI